ncbi:MAG TPA: hypothetical protein P5543_00770 [Planctomycetota bacterium]|nr:hypothetical protein [Planctomycetota bacterium]
MLWGGNIALGRKMLIAEYTLGRQCCSGEEILLWGGNIALGRKIALGRQYCSGEENVDRGIYSGELICSGVGSCSGEAMLLCSGEAMLLWEWEVARGGKIMLIKKVAIQNSYFYF